MRQNFSTVFVIRVNGNPKSTIFQPVPCELNLKATIILFIVNVTHKPTIIIFNPDIRLYVRVIVHVVSRRSTAQVFFLCVNNAFRY